MARLESEVAPATEDGLEAHFAIVSRDEIFDGGKLIETRLMHGFARQRANAIQAADPCDGALLSQCNAALANARAAAGSQEGMRVRIRVRATREASAERVDAVIILSLGGLSLVSTPAGVSRDSALLRELYETKPLSLPDAVPIVWRNGSAAVLLHEAIGHAAEQNVPEIAWPSWLSVEAPITWQRETFRDVPLRRMTHLIARQSEAPFSIPSERIDVQLIAGGAYDPLTDMVTVHVAVSSAGAFTIHCTRAEIAASLTGATGDPIRYPGVICSREGQELHVPSFAPVVLTAPLL